MKNALIIKPLATDIGRVCARLPGDMLAGRTLAVMSNGGRHMALARADSDPANLYAVGELAFDDIVIAQEFRMLYANDFTLAWLGSLLARLRGGAMWLQLANVERAEQSRLLTSARLRAALPGVMVDSINENLCRLSAPGGGSVHVAPEQFRSIFPRAQAHYAEFCARYCHLAATVPDHWLKVGQEEAQFIYAMMGANQKSWVSEGIAGEGARHSPLAILDIGGGFGHFGAEMASKGHSVTIHEVDPAKAAGLAPWLARECRVESRLTFVQGHMEDLEVPAGAFDLVTIFGSLLYAERARLPTILTAVWRGLKPGGAVIVHENPRDAVKPGAADYEYRFPATIASAIVRICGGTGVRVAVLRRGHFFRKGGCFRHDRGGKKAARNLMGARLIVANSADEFLGYSACLANF